MIDRDLFQLPGSGAIVKRLVGIKILQAVFIIAQAAFLADTLFVLWRGKRLRWCQLYLAPAAFMVGKTHSGWFRGTDGR